MMRASHTIFAITIAPTSCFVYFTNPPPFSDNAPGDYSLNPLYARDSFLTLSWTESGFELGPPAAPGESMVLALGQANVSNDQTNPLTRLSGFQELDEIDVNTTSYIWLVAIDPSKFDMEFSNVFTFSLFRGSNTTAEAVSHYFNVSKSLATTSTSTAPSRASPTITTTTVTTILSTTAPTLPAETSTIMPSATMDTKVKVSIGVGVALALILGILAGWFGAGWLLFKQYSAVAQVA